MGTGGRNGSEAHAPAVTTHRDRGNPSPAAVAPVVPAPVAVAPDPAALTMWT